MDASDIAFVLYVFIAFYTLLAFLLGASVGSFLGVVIDRVPRREPITGRSHCACGRQLKASENIPVFGWLRTGGKAKCCGSQIPAWYLWLEIGLGLLAVVILFLTPFNQLLAF